MTPLPKPAFALLALSAALALCGCQRRSAVPRVTVEAAWVRLPAVTGQPGSAYFTMEANSEGTALVGISSPLVRRVELHESVTKGGVARMKRLKEIEFPSNGSLEFEPDGRHAMLIGISRAVKPGQSIPLTFAFNVAPPITVGSKNVPLKFALRFPPVRIFAPSLAKLST